jgi:hypothetical protein
MADTDLIARVYLHGIVQDETLAAFQTSLYYVPPLFKAPRPLPAYHREERQPTEPPETDNVPELDGFPYVELRLDNAPRFRSGFVFGHDPDSDVVLPYQRGVGYHHFTLTFDEAKRPAVKDWGSLTGTEVTYGNQGHGVRRGFQWIVGGHDVPRTRGPIIVTIRADVRIRLQIIVAHHDVVSPTYVDKVDRFLHGTAATEDLFSSLDIPNRLDTERPTRAHTPSTGPIHLRKRLGEGSFAVVTHYWDVSTGEEYALKKPSAKAIRKRRVRVADWENEDHIMGLISHVSSAPHVNIPSFVLT